MKKKRQERIERRRSLVEINLIPETKSRSATMAKRGCALFVLAAAALAASAAAFLGLH